MCKFFKGIVPLLFSYVSGHGRLTEPIPRECEQGKCRIEDWDAPINFNGDGVAENKRWPPNNPSNHPEGQSFVCRVPNGSQEASVPTVINAGRSFNIKWEFTAAHPGDGGLYLSYDHDFADTQAMRFFKIAQFPQQRRNNKQSVQVKMPSWLPPGKAVLRWDWYATHNSPWTEFYANCVDVEVSSDSKLLPSSIPSYKMETGESSPTSYSQYNCQNCWCWDCPAKDWSNHKINGPSCVGGIEGNCCDVSSNFYTPVDFNANTGGGFEDCMNKGNSGPAPYNPTSTLAPPVIPNEWKCEDGQGPQGQATSVSFEANTQELCKSKCLVSDICKAFDFTSSSDCCNCRLYATTLGNRTGENAGTNTKGRKFCVQAVDDDASTPSPQNPLSPGLSSSRKEHSLAQLKGYLLVTMICILGNLYL